MTSSNDTTNAPRCIYCDAPELGDGRPCCAAASLTPARGTWGLRVCSLERHRRIVRSGDEFKAKTTPPLVLRFVRVGAGRTLELGICATCGQRLALELERAELGTAPTLELEASSAEVVK